MVCSGDEYYQITVRHVWDPESYFSESDSSLDDDFDLEECYFDGQSDEQNEEHFAGELEIMSAASQTLEDGRSSVDSPQLDKSTTTHSSNR